MGEARVVTMEAKIGAIDLQHKAHDRQPAGNQEPGRQHETDAPYTL